MGTTLGGAALMTAILPAPDRPGRVYRSLDEPSMKAQRIAARQAAQQAHMQAAVHRAVAGHARAQQQAFQ